MLKLPASPLCSQEREARAPLSSRSSSPAAFSSLGARIQTGRCCFYRTVATSDIPLLSSHRLCQTLGVCVRVIITGCFTLRGTVCVAELLVLTVCLLFSVFEQSVENRLDVDVATVKEHLMVDIILILVLCWQAAAENSFLAFSVCRCQQPLNNRWDPHPSGSLPLHLLLIDCLYCGSDGSPDLTLSFNLFYLFIFLLICVRKDLPVTGWATRTRMRRG